MNNSGIYPVGVSVLVKPDSVEQTSESGIIISTNQEHEREEMRQTDGIVVAIADNAFYDESKPRCQIGDRVIMAAYAGMRRIGNDGEWYRLINDDDIKAILVKKEKE